MPIAFAINGTKPSHIYSPLPSYFPLFLLSARLARSLRNDTAPGGAFVRMTYSALVILMIYTNVKYISQAFVFKIRMLKPQSYDAFLLAKYLKYQWREFTRGTSWSEHSLKVDRPMFIYTKRELLLNNCVWVYFYMNSEMLNTGNYVWMYKNNLNINMLPINIYVFIFSQKITFSLGHIWAIKSLG